MALVLSYPVRLLSRVLPRPLAIATAFGLLLVSIAFTISVLAPPLLEQLPAFLAAAPRLLDGAQQTLEGLLEPIAKRGLLPGTPDEFVAGLASELGLRARASAEGLLGDLLGLARKTLTVVLGALAAGVVAAYMLADGRKMKAAYLRTAPRRYRQDARELWEAFAHSLSRYLNGLLFVMAVQGAVSAVVLWLLGVPYAALLGAWVALTAVVPLLGAWLGAIPAVLVALSVSPAVALLTAIAFVAIQQLEGNLLTPRVMGDALGVHPVLILLAVIGGGQLAGAAGVLLAVPTLAACRVLLGFLGSHSRSDG